MRSKRIILTVICVVPNPTAQHRAPIQDVSSSSMCFWVAAWVLAALQVLLIMYRGFYVNHAYSIIITAVMLAINLFIGATRECHDAGDRKVHSN
jgi:hypothetical protein